MFDVAVEQIVKVKPPKTAVVYKALLIIGCIVAATTIPQTRTFGIIVLALFAVMTFLVFQYYNAELEYSIVDDTLTIDRIMAKSARKRCGVYTLSRAKLVARADSQDALRMNHMDVMIIQLVQATTIRLSYMLIMNITNWSGYLYILMNVFFTAYKMLLKKMCLKLLTFKKCSDTILIL